ncbi:hypothetical protein AOQ88_00880 [Candidatus Riesia sp. GBBU]|nr:hypothetical protein AOQ88_00880 [Candidatus Riesia sp. GBBU]
MKKKNRFSIEGKYIPSKIEETLNSFIKDQRIDQLRKKNSQEYYCTIIPPPNITGNLHIGHAFQFTLIDTLIRYKKMHGKKIICQFGTDHAGIATQIIIEKKILKEEKKYRYDYGKNKFLKKAWKWSEKLNKIIFDQVNMLGVYLNSKRNRFTLDKEFKKITKETFISLYNDGLIYQKRKLVNWDPDLCTVVSDIEVEKKIVSNHIFDIRYDIEDKYKTKDGKSYLVISTTRPETIFGDSAVAINPLDKRYNNLIGKNVIVPIVNRKIPIIGDSYVKIKKCTGCMKVTPAHDHNDYLIGVKNNLDIINIFDLNGNIANKLKIFGKNKKYKTSKFFDVPKKYKGLKRFSARDLIVKELKDKKLLVNKRSNKSSVLFNIRNNVIIELMLIKQWYLKTKIMSKEVISMLKSEKICFLPKEYKETCLIWLDNVQDWCISRQLWWGHRIPVWYDQYKNKYVGSSESDVRKNNFLGKDIVLYQENDVLDTWFSSSLWIFTIKDLIDKKISNNESYLCDILVSGFDIIFFWIVRMIILSSYVLRKKKIDIIPFKLIYITGLIRDENGKKMSKSLGNTIDLIDIINGISLKDLLKKRTNEIYDLEKKKKIVFNTKKKFPFGIHSYGSDSLRASLISCSSFGKNINWNTNLVNKYKNFCNKLWNASKYVLQNAYETNLINRESNKVISEYDIWILTHLRKSVKKYETEINKYRFDFAINTIYKFVWNKFCDWYLEFSKVILKFGNKNIIDSTKFVLINVLKDILKISFPIIPNLTEFIWYSLKFKGEISENFNLSFYTFLKCKEENLHINKFKEIEFLKFLIKEVRHVRNKMNLSKSRDIFFSIIENKSDLDLKKVYEKNKYILRKMESISMYERNKEFEDSFEKVSLEILNVKLFILIS